MMRNLSLNTKLIALTSLSVVLGLVVACTAFWINDVRTIRQAKIDQLFGIGRTLAFNCTGVLTFQNAEAAHELLSALEYHDFIEFACLRDADGHVFASIGQEPSNLKIPRETGESWAMTDHDHMVTLVPVFDPDFSDETLGTLTLVSNTKQMDAHFWNYLTIVAMTVLLALAMAVLPLLVMQREISRPILALAETAESISGHEDYSIRIYRDSTDEIGIMYRAFNGLLDRVQQSEIQIMTTQKELVDARERAEQASRAKSQFLANMSHEIRTPLTGILGFADLLIADSGSTDAAHYEYLRTIQHSGKHLLNLINDVLDLSKIEAGQLTVEKIMCSPHQAISEVVSVLRVKALEKDLDFEYRWKTDIPVFIRSDPARLKQLIMNLVGNAVKFTNSGGVAILAGLEPSADDSARSCLVVEVVDTGVGIAEDKLSEIFRPFVQADSSVTRKFGGTGLGLAISRNLAQMLGGDLSVTSIPGKGSTFRLQIDAGETAHLQVVRGEAADALIEAPSDRPAPQEEIGQVRLLLVEDGEVNRRFVSLVLQRSGAHVTTAENGEEGFNIAMSHEFDLVLMDMQMPVLDGYAATRKLRRAGFTPPIIALTAHAMVGDREKCIAAGCTDYLTKPIEANVLISTIAAHVRIALPTDTSASPETQTEPQKPRLQSSLPCEDDPEFQEIIEEFHQRLNEKLDLMEAAIQCEDSDELARLAHWLKGAGGTAGFPDFTNPALQLEQASRASSDQPELLHHLETLKGIADRIDLPWKV